VKQDILKRFRDSSAVIRRSGERLAARVGRAVEIVVGALRGGGGVFIFGNGGSAADAQHIAGELVGRFLKERRGFRAEALTTDTSVLTAVANDYDYRQVFARQLEAKARPGDVAIALSTSGSSPNVVLAVRRARRMGLKTVALTGQGGGKLAGLCDVLLDVPSRLSPRIQEAHAVIYHTLCEMVEQELTSAP
jgi:D-sedoheptulose 7-phosphate isomerase